MSVITEKKNNDLRCVWMSAGVVNYKLCDLNFNCENCEFHQAMQGLEHSHVLQKETQKDYFFCTDSENIQHMVNTYLSNLLAGCKIYLDRFYFSALMWLKLESDNHIQIGLDHLSLKILYPIDRFILPQVGDQVHQEQLLGWLVRGDLIIPLYSPVRGKIVEINSEFPLETKTPQTPDDNYLLKIKLTDSSKDFQRFNHSNEGIENYRKKILCIKSFLVRSLGGQQVENVGYTLGDGGMLEQNLETIMGTKLFKEFVQELFYRK